MPAKKPMIREGISTRPTDKYGNRATNADLGIGPGADAKRKAAAEKIMAREGTTSKSGGRAAVKMPAKVAMPKPTQVTRTTVNMKSSPMTTKRK
jgi:hypothetical protein